MANIDPRQLTTLLHEVRDGKKGAESRLMLLVYEELRRLARSYMRREKQDHTLQATALVNEMYVRISESEPIDFQNRAHFFAIAAKQMRRVLVDHARGRNAEKRGKGQPKVPLEDARGVGVAPDVDMLALDEALKRLEQIDPRASQVVELRYFAGLTIEQASQMMNVSLNTVKRDWEFARTWLFSQLGPAATPRASGAK